MKLRTQILIFLLAFGVIPLLSAVLINLPLVFGSLELFYQKAHLQNLRADFRDLDQHLASRHEMVRLLAKLPEPGSILGETEDTEKMDLSRARYTQWVNQILQDQRDIIQIMFLDDFGHERFWLERDPETQQWQPTMRMPDRPPEDFIQTAPHMEAGGVLVSRIRLNSQLGAQDPRRLMNLYLISPIVAPNSVPLKTMGSIVMSIDVGGIAQFYRNSLWVNNNGSYLQPGQPVSDKTQAFSDFPGLESIFIAGKLDLWKGPEGQQVLWVPLFRTENSGPLWVGRQVDPSPLAAFRNALVARVLMIILVLVIIVLIMARWIAVRLERFGNELTHGIDLMLKEDEAVNFSWRGPRELQTLGHDLSTLARSHAEHARSLRQHAQELEQTNRYKSEFLANVSHELRTPLNSILLLSKLLAEPDNGLSKEQGKQAQVIHHAGKDLQALIDNILDHSRIEARETRIDLSWFDPGALCQRLIDLVAPQFEQKGLYLHLEVVSGAPRQIHSDSKLLSQILKNFLANAVKFTDHGGVLITLESAGKDACPLAIRVKDSGIGIAADKQELIFEAFKQADGSTSRRYGGTGLGLSISRDLAHMLGGIIELRSTEGDGSVFSLLLPLDPENPQARPPQAENSPSGVGNKATLDVPAPTADFSGHTILLVEHDVSALLHLTPILENWGLHVSAAAEVEETLESLYEESQCALVLLDAEMPDGNGCATIERIRAETRFDQLPIIAMAAADNEDAARRCLAAGATALIERPVDTQRLKLTLEQHLPKAHAEPDHGS